MKLNPWIFPVLAMLVIGGWIGSQKKSAATLEREITIVTERIRMAGAIGDAGSEDRDAMAKTGKDKNGKIDWKDIAGKVGKENYNSLPDMRTMMRIQSLLMDATAEELCAQLDEIAALDIDEKARERLRSMIIGVLAEKDPKLAVMRFGTETEDEDWGTSWQIGGALGKWADKDPLGAAAWLDQQIAAGKLDSKSLDGKNDRRLKYEGAVVKALLDSNPGAAALRMKALPEDQRVQVLRDGFAFQMSQASEASYAKLVRDSVPADEVDTIFASVAVRWKDFARVDGFIANAKATAEETNAIVEQVMKNRMSQHGKPEFDVEELEKTRTWAASHSPQGVDKATGEALAYATMAGMDFEKAAEIALEYGKQGDNDEVLTAFLKSPTRNTAFPDQAKALIDKIKDPVLREEIRNLPQYRKPADEP